jgi:hypothetical protein
MMMMTVMGVHLFVTVTADTDTVGDIALPHQKTLMSQSL